MLSECRVTAPAAPAAVVTSVLHSWERRARAGQRGQAGGRVKDATDEVRWGCFLKKELSAMLNLNWRSVIRHAEQLGKLPRR